jgi:DNA repair exonuclease SbcCD ATPase subunit
MLTLDRQQSTAIDYDLINSSIKKTFAAIDRFESQAVDEILQMREQQIYREGGYKNFEEYCCIELSAWGGYRRINQLLGAKTVIDTAGELGEHIKNERQARSLLRLVKEPEKLKQAVALALEENPSPSVSDFAAAAKKVLPSTPRKKVQEPMVPENIESIAFLKEQHQQELERLEQELRIGLQVEATEAAEAQIKEQLSAYQELLQQQKEQNIQLQQRLDEMEGLRRLETENHQLQQRIQELERAVQQRPAQQWGNTMTAQATKALNKEVKLALSALEREKLKSEENTFTPSFIDLRSLATEPPKENAQECLRLMGMALKQIASAMNNTQALEAAAIILGSEPTQGAIAIRTEQLQLLPQAVSEIRGALVKPGCSWQDYWAVAEKYQSIEKDYLAELTTLETELIAALQNASTEQGIIGVGSIVAHADPYRTLYVAKGEVVEDLGEEVIVAWEHWRNESKKTDRYFKDELRFWFIG